MCNDKLLKLICWNADGVRNKMLELTDLVSALGIDIVAISESRLNSKITLSMSGYMCYRQDRHVSGRDQGVVLLIKENIVHCPISLPTTQHLEGIGVKLSISGTELIVISSYQSPNLPLITTDIDAMLSLGSRVVVMGDLNANNQM